VPRNPESGNLEVFLASDPRDNPGRKLGEEYGLNTLHAERCDECSFLEPGTPDYKKTLEILPRLIELVGSADRVNVRFDPILNLVDGQGHALTNFDLFPHIAQRYKEHGVREFTVSWATIYPRVRRRLVALGFAELDAGPAVKRRQAHKLKQWARSLAIRVKGCCTQPFLPGFGCINGDLLCHLHPSWDACSVEKAPGQRELCPCTKSRDIGWYYPCPNGCGYCYAQPGFDPRRASDTGGGLNSGS